MPIMPFYEGFKMPAHPLFMKQNEGCLAFIWDVTEFYKHFVSEFFKHFVSESININVSEFCKHFVSESVIINVSEFYKH